MAIRVFDAGAGLIVAKDNITSASLSWALGAIFGADATRFRRSALRLRSLMRMAGGSERGADLVAWVAGGSEEAGANMSSSDGTSRGARGNAGAAAVWQLPYSWRVSWVLAAGLDVAVIYALATMLAWAGCKRVCAYACARSSF
jgi:hypothetical protein